MSTTRQAYPSDVSHDDWALVVLYVTLLPDDVRRCCLHVGLGATGHGDP
ncbi:MAG: hypothetical protein ACXWP0_17910 [Ktedonobacterales bacterium]